MVNYTKYWIASIMRGVLAIFAALLVLAMPEMISLILLLPFAILLSMMCLAAYGTMDSVVVLVTSFFLPHHDGGRFALRVQGVIGAVCGGLLFFLVYDRAQLPWFLYLAAVQAAGVAVTEFIIARRTSVHHGSRWCYVAAGVSAVSAIVLVLGRNLEPQNIAWLLFGYLAVFGFTLCVLSARMLFGERKSLTRRVSADKELLATAS